MRIEPYTPVEQYTISKIVFVKREDLSVPEDGPSFSKVRGLLPVLIRLKKAGFTHVGYVETSVSMAGWGVAWAAKEVGLKAVIYNPIYKETPPLLKYHRQQWKRFDAIIKPIPAGMAKVNFHVCSATLKKDIGKRAFMLPLGLPFPETIEAAEQQALMTLKEIKPSTVVVNVGSGTVCAGLLRAFKNTPLYGIMGRTGSVEKKRKIILDKAQLNDGGFFGVNNFHLIDPGWEYTQESKAECPFPCHPWYDLKAWEWLLQNVDSLKAPILFWNIGSVPKGWNR